jgi:hypothetical protein
MLWFWAKGASQVASAEEDRPGPTSPTETVLLAEVREVRRDYGMPPDATQPRLIVEPVDLAQARADATAGIEQGQRLFRALAQLAPGVQREVGRLMVAHVRSLAPQRIEVTGVPPIAASASVLSSATTHEAGARGRVGRGFSAAVRSHPEWTRRPRATRPSVAA